MRSPAVTYIYYRYDDQLHFGSMDRRLNTRVAISRPPAAGLAAAPTGRRYRLYERHDAAIARSWAVPSHGLLVVGSRRYAFTPDDQQAGDRP